MSYFPVPPRVWSRLQNECSVNTNSSNLVYYPLTGQYVTQDEFNRLKQIQIKGNILQYKNNSSQLTKKQKYSQIAKGQWTNRTKTWATQSLTYSNPNTTSLQRVNTSTLAATANTPFVSNTYTIPPNPFGCPIDLSGGIIDGGNLVATVTVNPCTNEIIKTTTISNCSLSTDCDVPGPPIALCWDSRLPTYYPRQNLTNNNSTSKWPYNYKGLVSALRPIPPILILNNIIDNTVYLSWTYDDKTCIPITSFHLYQILNGITSLINTIPFPITSTQIYNLLNCSDYTFYITALSTNVESEKSNEVSAFIRVLYGPIITNIVTGCASATLTWQSPNISCINITNYYIYQNNIKIKTISPFVFADTIYDLSYCTDYNFNVSYYDSISGKESYLSNTAIVTEIPCPPSITSIVFDPSNNSQNIYFSAPIASCTLSSYYLYQGIDPSNTYIQNAPFTLPLKFNIMASNLQNVGNYSQGEHTFKMKSYSNTNGKYSAFSNILVIPPPPINLYGNIISPSEIKIYWTNQSPLTVGINITKNRIYLNNVLFDTIDLSNNYLITNLIIGNTYNINVTSFATDSSGNITESIYSNTIQITLPNIINIYNLQNYDSSNSYVDQSFNYGSIIFTEQTGSLDISFNYTGYNINIIAIGPGGNGGFGGIYTINGGGGGGGGGGAYTESLISSGNYTYNITVGYSNNNTIINFNGNNIIANPGSSGEWLQNQLTTTGGQGGYGGNNSNAGGNGGKGNGTFDFSGGPGSNGIINNKTFSIGSGFNMKTYNLFCCGGGGGGASTSGSGYNGGNYAGGAGGGPSTVGQSGTYEISMSSPSVYNIYAGGGGGGGGGSVGTSSKGGSGSQGLVIFYWDFLSP